MTIFGPLPRGGNGKCLLRLLVEDLAERYDLEVILDMNDTSFVANFGPATPIILTQP